MYFINPKIAKSIANEVYRDAGFTVDNNSTWYVIYDSEYTFKEFDFTVVFTVNRVMPDDTNEFKHFLITVSELKNNDVISNVYHTTNTLNRKELGDKLYEIITRYEKTFKNVA